MGGAVVSSHQHLIKGERSPRLCTPAAMHSSCRALLHYPVHYSARNRFLIAVACFLMSTVGVHVLLGDWNFVHLGDTRVAGEGQEGTDLAQLLFLLNLTSHTGGSGGRSRGTVDLLDSVG